MPRVGLCFAAVIICGSASAQDNVEGPFYKFSTTIPDVVVSNDGSRSDLNVEYLSNEQGQVSNIELEAAGLTSSINDLTPNDNTMLCRRICLPDPSSPTGVRCVGCIGPNSDVILFSLDTMPTDEGFDFKLGVQRPFDDEVSTTTVPGFEKSTAGEVAPIPRGE